MRIGLYSGKGKQNENTTYKNVGPSKVKTRGKFKFLRDGA
jgi:hypothetical protein